jgi:hypothetical protein
MTRAGLGPFLWIALVLTLATRLYYAWAIPLCAEDAYITFRFAENWAHGLGPIYNAGERAWGFTSALWTSVLALTSLAGAPIELTARALLVLCDLGTLLCGVRLLGPHTRAGAVGFALFFATFPRLAHVPATGLECSLVTFLLFATACLAKTRFGGVLNGLLALARPEGAAMSAIQAWALSWRQRLVWIVVASSQGAFMLWFGRLAPSSVASKAAVYGVQWGRGFHWFEWLVPGLPPTTADGEAFVWWSAFALVGLVAALVRWSRRPPTDPALLLLLASGIGTLAGYAALGVPWTFWYMPTPMTAILAVAAYGLGTLVTTRTRARVAASLALVALALSWPRASDRVIRRQTRDAAVFESIGETLRDDARGKPATVMLEPIGIIGYRSGFRVVDEVGLVTPRIADERRRGSGWYARVIARERPDYVVFRRDWLKGGVSWAGIGEPFVSDAQRESTMSAYAIVSRRVGAIPPGAARYLILKRH